MAREIWVQSQVESYQRLKKWYLMPPCLTLSIIRYGSRVKWSNPGKGVAPSPTPRCSKLSKREPSGHPRLWSPTYIYKYIYIYETQLLSFSPMHSLERYICSKCWYGHSLFMNIAKSILKYFLLTITFGLIFSNKRKYQKKNFLSFFFFFIKKF